MCALRDSGQTLLTNDQISLLTHVWLDPENLRENKTLLYTLLFLPFLIFVISCILIFYSWTIPVLLPGIDQLNWWLYTGLYILSLLVFIFCYLKIYREY